jgi:RNA polymerase sigma-70 factor (ECF subfamily)
MRRYAINFLQDEEEANDLIQDVFLQLWAQREELQEEKNLIAFLFTLLKNKCLNSLKKKVVENKYLQNQSLFETERLYALSFAQSTDFKSMESQLNLEIESLIAQMPEKCGIVFRLKWLEGKKIKEIATLLDISTTMVDKHLARGMEIARKKINPDLFLFYILNARQY